MIAKSAWHDVGKRIGTLFIWVNKAYSRGAVTLRSSDVRSEPDVDFRLLSDERDLERLKYGFRVGAAGLSHASMDGWRGPVFPTSYSPRVAAIGAPGPVEHPAARRLLGSSRFLRTAAAGVDPQCRDAGHFAAGAAE